jgi:hypothetical protein
MKLFHLGIAALGLTGLCTSNAVADDWLMFRKDAGRTASSTDTIELPMRQAWSFSSLRVAGRSPLSSAAVRGDMIYFIAGSTAASVNGTASRTLIAADLKTGEVRWSRALNASRMHAFLPEDIGPALTEGGTVYVLDTGLVDCAEGGYVLKAFSAGKGNLLGERGVSVRNSLDRFFLRHEHGEQDFLLKSFQKPDC